MATTQEKITELEEELAHVNKSLRKIYNAQEYATLSRSVKRMDPNILLKRKRQIERSLNRLRGNGGSVKELI